MAKSKKAKSPRNPFSQHPMMRKGGVHKKSNSAKRTAARREIQRQSRDWSTFLLNLFSNYCPAG